MTTQSIQVGTPSGDSQPEGHVEAMIAKVDAANAPAVTEETQVTTERPSWLPEKFASAEDMAAAYASLETKLSQGKPVVEPVVATPAVETPPAAKVEETLKASGMTMQQFAAEFNETGELSQDSYTKLLAAGYDKGIVDNYIAGQQAVATAFTASVMTEAGGEEAYGEMMAWAKNGMSAEDQDAYNVAVSSGNLAQAKFAVTALKSRFAAENGNEPRLVGGKVQASSQDAFESVAQLTAAMADPKYQKDSAYRAAVQAKLGRSELF